VNNHSLDFRRNSSYFKMAAKHAIQDTQFISRNISLLEDASDVTFQRNSQFFSYGLYLNAPITIV
jgi:hypothetical protein